jgi:AcrR family transcriptional regulator
MGVNPELNELQKEVTRQRILETGFRVFAEGTIEKVKMSDVAKAGGVGTTTVYRYYKTKPELVLAISTWAWGRYLDQVLRKIDSVEVTAAEEYEYFLDTFLDMYHNHRNLLRFNQFFNVYVQNEEIPHEVMKPYLEVVKKLEDRFAALYERAEKDHTIRTDIPAKEMLLTSMHLMLAAVTRYAVGLVYEGGMDPEKELVLQKNMLLREFTKNQ